MSKEDAIRPETAAELAKWAAGKTPPTITIQRVAEDARDLASDLIVFCEHPRSMTLPIATYLRKVWRSLIDLDARLNPDRLPATNSRRSDILDTVKNADGARELGVVRVTVDKVAIAFGARDVIHSDRETMLEAARKRFSPERIPEVKRAWIDDLIRWAESIERLARPSPDPAPSSKQKKRIKCDDAMKMLLLENGDAWGWSIRKCCAETGFSIATIADTPTWKMMVRNSEMGKAQKAMDRHRN